MPTYDISKLPGDRPHKPANPHYEQQPDERAGHHSTLAKSRPVDGRFTNFDYDALDPKEPDPAAERMADLTMALGEFCHWLADSSQQSVDKIDTNLMGRRIVMALWIMKPEVFRNRSLPELAGLMGVSEPALSKIARRFTEKFGIHGRAQLSTDTRGRMSIAKSLPKPPADITRN